MAEVEPRQKEPLFSMGEIVATSGALAALEHANFHPGKLLTRHVTGDWGELDEEDQKENELSLEKGFRILSAYNLPTGERIWVITEADRSSTCILLPDEY